MAGKTYAVDLVLERIFSNLESMRRNRRVAFATTVPPRLYFPAVSDISTDHDSKDFDLSCLEQNLKLSPEERAVQHQRALDILLEIKNARKQLYEQSEQSSENTAG